MILLIEYIIYLHFSSSFFSSLLLPLPYLLSFLLPSFLFLVFALLQSLLLSLFSINLSSGMDLFFDIKNKVNQSTIVAVCVLSKPLPKDIHKKIENNIMGQTKYSRLTQIMHTYHFISFWSRSPSFRISDHLITSNKAISSEEELCKIMGEQLASPYEENKPKWKFLYFPKYMKGKAVTVMKVHHTIADGISVLSFFMDISKAENVKFIKFPKITIWNWLQVYLILPFALPYFLLKNLLRRSDMNKIHGFQLTGKKKVYSLLIKHSLDEMKELSKSMELSINDFFTATLVHCVKIFYEKTFSAPLNSVNIFMPVSLRGFPEPKQIYPLNNWILPMVVHFSLPAADSSPKTKLENNGKSTASDDSDKKSQTPLRTLFQPYKKVLFSVKKSFEAPILFIFTRITAKIFPPSFFLFFLNYLSSKLSFGFTNVPGPLETFKLYGSKVEELFFLVPTLANIGLGFSLMTYGKKLRLSLQADEGMRLDVKGFSKEYENVIEEMLEEWRKKKE